jgi:membrane protease YdiL (CAAX protease family)
MSNPTEPFDPADPFDTNRRSDLASFEAPERSPLDPANAVGNNDCFVSPPSFSRPTLPPPSSRVPHLGHVTIFLSFAFLVLLLSQLLLIAPHAGHAIQEGLVMQPKRQIAAMAIAYLVTLGFCLLAFPLFWRRGFLLGVHWNGPQALRFARRLIPLGFVLGLTVQAISSLIPMPKSIPMDDYFRSRSDVWLVTVFGITLAPLFEELCFRGFLLPAFTIALDWLGPLLRYLAAFSFARLRGEEPPQNFHFFADSKSAGLAPDTDNLTFRSRTAILGASIITSILFALLHAEQLAHAWSAVIVLFFVSLALTAVRIRTRSVACSTLVHASYNLSVFITLFIATGGYRHLEKMAK